jgi:hypothetical protein
MSAGQLFSRLGQLGLGLAAVGGIVNSALYNVDAGHRAIIFDRFQGVKNDIIGEGTHFFIPWVQKPIVFDCRSRPRNVPVVTGSKDLQNVNITLRILFRPVPDKLPYLYTTLGQDYDERVLPSITNEILKAVTAQFDAGELITQRELVSAKVRVRLLKCCFTIVLSEKLRAAFCTISPSTIMIFVFTWNTISYDHPVSDIFDVSILDIHSKCGMSPLVSNLGRFRKTCVIVQPTSASSATTSP